MIFISRFFSDLKEGVIGMISRIADLEVNILKLTDREK